MTAKRFYVSASQWKTADLCMRKWVFERIKKLPVYKAAYFGFGSVLHKCAERFLNGERELFPEGWDIDDDTKVRLEPNDAQLIVVLIHKAIDEGILERRPGGEAEKKFEFEVLPGVWVTGFQDYRTFEQIEDHKTSKSRRYLLSPKKLLECIQMNTYGKERLIAATKRGTPPPPVITYRHNQFLKDYENPVVKKTEAETTPHKIETFWREKIIPLTKKMLAAMTVENVFEIEDPPASACQAFGGCPFTSLCSGGETMESYAKRISYMQQQQSTPKEVKTVSVSDWMNKRKAAREGGVPTTAPQVNPPKEAAPEQAAVATVEDDGDQVPPPWFSENCKICSTRTINRGFNRETNKPCRMCLTLSKVPTTGIVWEVMEDGTIVWEHEGQKTTKPAPKVEAAPARKTYTVEELCEAIDTVTSVEEARHLTAKALSLPEKDDRDALCDMIQIRIAELSGADDPAAAGLEQAEAPKPEPEPEPAKPASRRRQKKTAEPAASADTKAITSSPEEVAAGPSVGLIVIYGCALSKPWPGRDMVTAEEILAKTEGYYQNPNAFERRDALRTKILQNKEEWAEKLSNTVIQASVLDPDVTHFISSLAMLPNAVVIHGTR